MDPAEIFVNPLKSKGGMPERPYIYIYLYVSTRCYGQVGGAKPPVRKKGFVTKVP